MYFGANIRRISLKMIHSRAEMNQISNYLYPNRQKTLLLILYAIIRFQPFQFYSQTPCWKAIAAEGRKSTPARIDCKQGGVLSAHSAFSDLTVELYIHRGRYIYSPYWIYISTMMDLYAHQVGYIDSPLAKVSRRHTLPPSGVPSAPKHR